MALYKNIHEDIIQDILAGIYEAGQMIDGQEVYAKKFNISRATVRKAIDELVEKKVLFTVKGKGTYVNESDARSFGVRTPVCAKEIPSYGIIGMFHILPPSLHGYGG